MNILFTLKKEKDRAERATGLAMEELNRRGHQAISLLHINQDNPDEIFMNGKAIPSLSDFLSENEIDTVVNQNAFHDWLFKEFFKHGSVRTGKRPYQSATFNRCLSF